VWFVTAAGRIAPLSSWSSNAEGQNLAVTERPAFRRIAEAH
jgi:hypothetical protein